MVLIRPRPISRLLAAALAALLLVCAHRVRAQGGDIEIRPSAAALACLTSLPRKQSLPVYPAGRSDTSAVVRVGLTFVTNDAAPTVEFTFNNGGEPFANAVHEHVAGYRLPCLRRGDTVSAVQEFQFVAAKLAVLESPARDEAKDFLNWEPECRVAVEKAPPPRFPVSTSFQGSQGDGTVLVRMTFSAPDRPPEVKVLFDGGQHRLAAAVRESVSHYRLPCMRAGDAEITADRTFSFTRGESAPRLQPNLSLQQLLGMVTEIERSKVRFDFTTMGCPFTVRFTPYQPYNANGVLQIAPTDAGRREFVEWLRGLTLELPPRIQRTALGNATLVSVPCVVLDLT